MSASTGLSLASSTPIALPDVIDVAPFDQRIRAGEIDIFEDAEARLLRLERETGSRCPCSVTTTISPGSMSRTKRAPMMSSAQVSEARIQAPSRSPSTSGRMPSGSRQPIIFLVVSATSEKAPSSWRTRVDEAGDEVLLAAGGDQMQQRLGVGGGGEDRALLLQLALHGHGVGDVAVVGDGEAAVGEFGEQRLHVAQARSRRWWNSGCGRWRGRPSAGRSPAGLVKVSPIRPTWRSTWNWLPSIGDDAGRLLAAVLQRMQAERDDGGRILPAENAEHAAFVVEMIVGLAGKVVVCHRACLSIRRP